MWLVCKLPCLPSSRYDASHLDSQLCELRSVAGGWEPAINLLPAMLGSNTRQRYSLQTSCHKSTASQLLESIDCYKYTVAQNVPSPSVDILNTVYLYSRHNAKDRSLGVGRDIDWIEQCFTSPPTQYRLYGRRLGS